MTGLSRREFFRKLTYDVADQVNLQAAKNSVLKIFQEKHSAASGGWTAVGRMAEMSPGIELIKKVGETTLTLRANSSGVWATTLNKKNVALRSGPGGVILVNPLTEWPPNRVLSHATLEQIDLESETAND